MPGMWTECSCEHLLVMLGWEGAGTNPRLHRDVSVSVCKQHAGTRLLVNAHVLLGSAACLHYPIPICCWLKACVSTHVHHKDLHHGVHGTAGSWGARCSLATNMF